MQVKLAQKSRRVMLFRSAMMLTSTLALILTGSAKAIAIEWASSGYALDSNYGFDNCLELTRNVLRLEGYRQINSNGVVSRLGGKINVNGKEYVAVVVCNLYHEEEISQVDIVTSGPRQDIARSLLSNLMETFSSFDPYGS